MTTTFEGPVLFVADINQSRQFYEQVMKQKVKADHGKHMVFENGFFLWQTDSATETIYGRSIEQKKHPAVGNFELYFESDDIRAEWERLKSSCDTIVNELAAAPWLQLAFRVQDPDGYIVEIGEPLPQLIKRLYEDGMSPAKINGNTSIPIEFVNDVLGL